MVTRNVIRRLNVSVILSEARNLGQNVFPVILSTSEESDSEFRNGVSDPSLRSG